MSFAENLQFLRTREGMTQEGLAELLEVTRQSVSKWESGGSYPEMEKLLQMCRIFHTDLDTLLRGNAADDRFREDAEDYDTHMNWFARVIAGGSALIMLGLCVMFFLLSRNLPKIICSAVFLSFVAAAAVLFIVGGMSHDSFQQNHPVHPDPYSPQQKLNFSRRFAVCIAVSVAGILIGVVWMMLLSSWADKLLMSAAFFLTLSVCVPALVWAGIQKNKFNLTDWNQESSPNPAAERQTKE